MHRWLRKRARLAVTVALLGATVATTVQPTTASASTLHPTGCAWSLGYLPALDNVMTGHLALPGASVNIGTGRIDWTLANRHGIVWAKYFMSLSWILSPVHLYEMRHETQPMYLKRAEQIAADFVAHVPVNGGPARAATWSAMYAGQRAHVFGCLASIDPGFAPAFRELRAMGPWLANPANDPGTSNQGVDFRIGGLAAGCVTRNPTWATLARDKLGTLAATAIDAQGAPHEQSTSYASRLVTVFSDAATLVAHCFGTSQTIIGTRLRALRNFLAWANEPSGGLAPLGDSGHFASRYVDCTVYPGLPPLRQAGTSKVFAAGYAFGRTNWNAVQPGTPPPGHYALRFGPGRIMHGHDDHQSLTWTARNNPLLIDPGYAPYLGAFTTYSRGPDAHNVLTEPGVGFDESTRTTLVRSRVRTAWQSYELSDTAYGGRSRVRDVLIDLASGIVVVEDRASRAHSGTFNQLWHLPTEDSVSVSRTGIASAGRCPDTTMWITPVPLRGQTIALHSTGLVKGQLSPYQGWAETGWSSAPVPSPVVVLRRSGTSVRMLTVLTVGPHAVRPRMSRTWSATSGYVYTINNAGAIRHVRLDNTGLLTEI